MASNGGQKRKSEALCSNEEEIPSDVVDFALSRPHTAQDAAVQSTGSRFTKELKMEKKTLQDVPQEILDLILLKTVFKAIASKNLLKLVKDGKMVQEVMELRTVWSEWNNRLTTNWFKIMFKSRLKTLGWLKFRETPVQVGVLNSTWFKHRVIAMTILDDTLYIIGDPQCKFIQEYNLNDLDFKEFWSSEDRFGVEYSEGGPFGQHFDYTAAGHKTPVDLVSCKKTRHLFASFRIDRTNAGGAITHYYEVVPLRRVLGAGKEIDVWPEMELSADSGILSVTGEANILMVDRWNGKLMEFTSVGILIRTIDLSRASIHPSHAVKTSDGYYVTIDSSAVDESQHRVCKVDARGNVLRSFGGAGEPTEGLVNFPTYLAINEDGFVFVAEKKSSRVLVLGADLRFKRVLVTRDRYGLRSVDRIALDEKRGRLLVTDTPDGGGVAEEDRQAEICVLQMVEGEFIDRSVKDEIQKALAAKREREHESDRLCGSDDDSDDDSDEDSDDNVRDSDETSSEEEYADYDYDIDII